MKKGNNKKGFTLVELLVVIAILAILAVVSVVGYTSFLDKARKSNDISLTKQMNNILQAEEVDGEKNETAYEAVQQLEEGGLDVTKLTPTTDGYHYVYDIKQNRMFLLDSTYTKVAPTDEEPSSNAYLFAFVGSTTEIKNFSGYSYYLKSGFDFSEAKTNSIKKQDTTISSTKSLKIENGAGVDVGENKNVKLTYTCSVTSDVVIRTTGDQASVTIKPTSETSGSTSTGSIKLYGFAQTVAVETSTPVAVSGACNELVVAKGTIKVEETGVVFKAVVPTKTTETVKIENSGYVSDVYTASSISVIPTTTSDKTESYYSGTVEVSKNNSAVSGNTAGGNYEISTLAQLESFRDTVNAGATFENKTVELKKDITLKDGWTPIGEGSRKVNKTGIGGDGTYFSGTFKGNNHTIYNLNNKGFVPTSNRIVKDDAIVNGSEVKDQATYAYGLFALAEDASFENLKLVNVDIDESRCDDAYIDSVGGLVGYVKNSGSIKNVTVSGSIYGNDTVGGIVGRYYSTANEASKTYTLSINNCTNNASLKSEKKVAGIVGYTQISGGAKPYVTFTDCTNNGTITATIETKDNDAKYYGDQLITCQSSDQAFILWTGFSANGEIVVSDTNVASSVYNIYATQNKLSETENNTKGQNYSS